MMCIKTLIVFIITGCFVMNTATASNIVTNEYHVKKLPESHTCLDTVYDNFQSYFGVQEKDTFYIEKPYDAASYRLNKKVITLINYTNTSDSTVHLKFYATLNRYCSIGEIDTVENNKIKLKKSNSIIYNKQFFEIKSLPHTNMHAYLIHQPISFKDYFLNKNQVFNYSNIYLFPEYDGNTYKENIGFLSLMLFLLGMVFILFLFYGLAYINLKDKIYLSYALYLFFTFFQVLYMAQYVFAKNMMMFNIIGSSWFDECTKGLMIVFYSIFYKQAFEINKKQKVLFFSVEALRIISLMYILLIVVSYLFKLSFYFEPFVYTVYRFPIFFFSLIILIYSIRLKNKTTFQNMILLGSLIYTVFTIFTTFQKTDYPVKDLLVAINGLYLGVALELIVFSIALGLRIRDSYLKTEMLQDKLILELQHNEEFIKNENNKLEDKVKERVSEIEKQNIFIEEQKRQALIQTYEKEKLEIQLQALSAQMNPHFIFNCMNSIQHLIITKQTDKASQMLHDFASLIRIVLEQSLQTDILIEDEIKLLQSYLKLEQERTNHSFDFEIFIDESISIDFVKIPTMMVQPFLENALLHGFKFINYKGKIDVRFAMHNQMVCIEVEDNGIGRELAMENKLRYRSANNRSVAIHIIQNRIDLLNLANKEQKSALMIEDLINEQNKAIGTKVTIYLPVI
ncbi:MAG: histidine kinase [Chitinophagales bacterium]